MIRMAGVFESNASLFVFLAMSIVSLGFSFYFYRKTRFLKRFSKNLQVNVFNKTYNVFDPYPERRKSVNMSILLPLIIVFLYLFIGLVILKFFEAGLVLGFTVFMVCLSLMLADEAYELYTNARIFTKAIRNGSDIGRGDLRALSLLTKIMPKLSKYYVILASVFLTSAAAFSFIAPAAITGLSLFIGMTIESTSFVGGISPYLALFVFTIAFMTVYFVAGRLKTRLFGLSPAVPLTVMEEQFMRVKIMSKWGEAPPYELSHRPVLEDAEVEERKRKALRSEE